ncbi:hypothetical protein QMP26_30855 [Enterocloster clostridioformis]|uniref:hypothetical protein n=1 Tax=Enterocloster clostridioformis TaxID=1531 RepID=UPI0026762A0A|nr:hypothetical protein [Enterocloster clostridioformis]
MKQLTDCVKGYVIPREALGQMPELIHYMARLSRKNMKVTVEEFAGQLKYWGYVDFTQRVCPSRQEKSI